MKKRLVCLNIVLLCSLPIFVSCATQEFDIANNSAEKGYIRFVADTENIPNDYEGAPTFNVIFNNPVGETIIGSFFAWKDVIITAPPGSHSFLLQPYKRGKYFKVLVNAVKDHVVTVNCYIIIQKIESSSHRDIKYGYKHKTIKTTYNRNIYYRFKYIIDSAKPYPN